MFYNFNNLYLYSVSCWKREVYGYTGYDMNEIKTLGKLDPNSTMSWELRKHTDPVSGVGTMFLKPKLRKESKNGFKKSIEVEKIWEDSLDSIPSPSPSVKNQIMGRKG